MKRACVYTRADGRQCEAHAIVGREFCYFHEPELAARRKAASSAGGKAYKPAVRSDGLSLSLRKRSEICKLNEFVANMLLNNEVDHGTANSATQMGNILLRALKLDGEELRIRNLESLGGLGAAPDSAGEPDVGEPDMDSEPAAGMDEPRIRLRNIDDVRNLLEDAINMVLNGQIDARIANAIGLSANAQLRLISIGLAERKERLEAADENRRRARS